jgi:beta-glucanase (GH16 family)
LGCVADDERGNVLEITHAGTENTAGIIIMSSNPVDLRNAEIDGVLKLDIKVVSGDQNISFRPDCIYPCSGAYKSKRINQYNQWQTVSVAVKDLIPGGDNGNVLDLEIVRSALVTQANSATKFRIDNVYFDCGEVITCAGVSDLFIPVDWAATHEDPNLGNGNDAIPREYLGYTMVWSDNFDGDVVDEDNWDFDLGNGMNGWGNGERQYYRQQNATVDDGLLIIEAKKHVPYINIGDITGIHYTSARLVTRGKMEFKYGRVDIRAVVAEGQGMWSAGWMLGANHSQVGWPQSGEIDIFETIGGQNRESKMINNMFWNPYGSATQADIISRNLAYEYGIDSTNPNETFANQFHVFSLIWDEGTIQFEVDGVNTGNDIDLVGDLADTFRNPFYLLLNVAVGGTYPGYPDETTSFPDGMLVDYVRVYQRDSDGDGIADFELDGKTTLDQCFRAS